MLSFKLSALLLACGLTSLSASSVIFEEQKIKVYNVPHSEVNNLDAKKLSEYTEKKPLYSVSQGVSPGKTLIKTPSEDVVVVLEKIFYDIQEKKAIQDFKVKKELKGGIGNILNDTIILEPNIGGIGVNLNNLFKFLKW